MRRNLPVSPVGHPVPPLRSGGVMLSWRCPSACRHCVYRSSPDMPDAWMSPATMDRAIEALVAEPELQGIHIGGGEPTMNPHVLEAFIRKAVGAGLSIDYLETNGYRFPDPSEWIEFFQRLKAAGLERVMVSCSPFHQEKVPFRNTQACYLGAKRVFGDRAVFAYTGEMYELLLRMGEPGTRPLERFLDETGLADSPADLPRACAVIPSGRAPEALRFCYEAAPAEAFRDLNCRVELFDTTHFHIDGDGNLITGLCAGIAAAALPDLHPTVAKETHPAFTLLYEGGPYALLEAAVSRHGHAPRAEGYVSKCDLCLDARRALHATGDYPDLRPDFYYR